jgi:hypothetical protein
MSPELGQPETADTITVKRNCHFAENCPDSRTCRIQRGLLSEHGVERVRCGLAASLALSLIKAFGELESYRPIVGHSPGVDLGSETHAA